MLNFEFSHIKKKIGTLLIKVWFGKVEGVLICFWSLKTDSFMHVAYMAVKMMQRDLVPFAMLRYNYYSKVDFILISFIAMSSAPVAWVFKDHYMHYGLSKARKPNRKFDCRPT